MTGKKIGYIRVSTADQNPDRQLEGLELNKRFTDYASGTSIKRPQLEAMIEYVRDDDHIFVHSLDRLGRNVKDLLNLMETLIDRGITIHFIKENLIFDSGSKNPMSKLLLMVMGAIAEFEHSLIRERQMEGIAIAKKEGKYKGRPHKLKPFMIDQIDLELKTSRKPKTIIAKEMGISRYTLYRYIKERKHGIV